jgi:hypothetical protein
VTDHQVIEAMMTFGGRFVQNLGKALKCADERNFARLKNAFSDYLEQYREVAELQEQRA